MYIYYIFLINLNKEYISLKFAFLIFTFFFDFTKVINFYASK
jgi:hypothetical protein